MLFMVLVLVNDNNPGLGVFDGGLALSSSRTVLGCRDTCYIISGLTRAGEAQGFETRPYLETVRETDLRMMKFCFLELVREAAGRGCYRSSRDVLFYVHFCLRWFS